MLNVNGGFNWRVLAYQSESIECETFKNTICTAFFCAVYIVFCAAHVLEPGCRILDKQMRPIDSSCRCIPINTQTR